MAENMADRPENLITTKIKGRRDTYYLTTDQELETVKSNSLLGDIFFGLFAVAVGGIISAVLTEATGIKFEEETIRVLRILRTAFVVGAVFCGCFSTWFFYQSYGAIKKIKCSGTVESFKGGKQEVAPEVLRGGGDTGVGRAQLEIIEARYGTESSWASVAAKLREKIVDNTLDVMVNNDLVDGNDPKRGTIKKLTVEYNWAGITYKKTFNEQQRMVIPF